MPAPSVPRTRGKRSLPVVYLPARISASHTPTPAPCRARSTSPGPGWGTGRVWSVRTSGGPKRSMAAAFMVPSRVRGSGAVLGLVMAVPFLAGTVHRIVVTIDVSLDPQRKDPISAMNGELYD